MTDADLSVLLRWNQDPEILHYSEGDDVESRTMEEVERIYGGVSQSAFCFIVEREGRAIGECWLQEMNLSRLLDAHPGCDLRRIDLVLGEKEEWGKGYGSEVIRTLVDFGFSQQGADLIFGCQVADYNARSLRAFERAGFREHGKVEEPEEAKASDAFDLVITRDEWEAVGESDD